MRVAVWAAEARVAVAAASVAAAKVAAAMAAASWAVVASEAVERAKAEMGEEEAAGVHLKALGVDREAAVVTAAAEEEVVVEAAEVDQARVAEGLVAGRVKTKVEVASAVAAKAAAALVVASRAVVALEVAGMVMVGLAGTRAEEAEESVSLRGPAAGGLAAVEMAVVVARGKVVAGWAVEVKGAEGLGAAGLEVEVRATAARAMVEVVSAAAG